MGQKLSLVFSFFQRELAGKEEHFKTEPGLLIPLSENPQPTQKFKRCV